MAHLYVIAGHGAGDPGATGNGYTEAERVRVLANKIKQLGGENVTLGDLRRNFYADKGISSMNIPKDWCIIELHMDSGKASARGAHVIIKGTHDADSYDLSLASFVGAMFPGRANKIVGRNDLANPNRAAARGYNYRLVEFGFISNATDVSIFNNNLDAIARGILSCFRINTNTAKWVRDDVGWWYRYADGSYPKGKWLKLDTWYYFNAKGYALANEWINYKNKWYYLKDDCRMAESEWRKVDGYWYYLGSDGAMLDGWQKVSGKWYYLDPDGEDRPHGAMAIGKISVDGYDYIMKGSGEMVSGWYKSSYGEWYYYNKDKNCQPVGSMMRNHWQGEYYLKDDGRMAHGETLTIGGKEFTFAEDGKMM